MTNDSYSKKMSTWIYFLSILLIIDSTIKNIEYEIPNNVTSVNTDLSKCGDQEDNLIVGWSSGNSFEIKFVKNNRTYELSTFKIALNLTDVMKDARGQYSLIISFNLWDYVLIFTWLILTQEIIFLQLFFLNMVVIQISN